MEKIIISNINEKDRNWDHNLNWEFYKQDDEHMHSFDFKRSTISSPMSSKGKLEIYFYSIPPGKANFPYHYHTANEEVFYIMSGHGTLRTPDGDRTVSEGDAIVMPANENGAHQLINTSQIPLTYLEVKTAIVPEICIQPDSDKAVLIAPPKFFAKSYKIDSDVKYLYGEYDKAL